MATIVKTKLRNEPVREESESLLMAGLGIIAVVAVIGTLITGVYAILG